MPWTAVHVFQVDERVASEGETDRNLTQLRKLLLDRVPLPSTHIHVMPVESSNLDEAVADYSADLNRTAGTPAVLDVIHLGMGPDGHTASLVPRDTVLDILDQDIAMTGPYQERRRMTMTYPILNRARRVLWFVTGADKAGVLARMVDGDASIPAGRVCRERAHVITDRPAAALVRA